MARPSDFPLMTPGAMRMYSTQEMVTMPPPEWLIKGILPAGGLVGLYGPPGIKKSFVAVDIALSVAAGVPWQGHETAAGYPLYIGAEGGTGIGKRVKAWLMHKKLKPRQAEGAWLLESVPVYADSDGMRLVLERVERELAPQDRVPHLIIIDTLARCFDGDENQQEDMGRFVAGVDHLRKELDATVIVVHHTRLDGDRERGNTAFRGAADTMLSLSQEKDNIVLKCNKQKDSEEFEKLFMRVREVPDADSIVLIPESEAPSVRGKELRKQETLEILNTATDGLSWDLWLQQAGVTKVSFNRYIREFLDTKQIVKENGVYRVI